MDCSRFISQEPLPKYSVQIVLRTPRIAVSGNSHTIAQVNVQIKQKRQ